MPPKEDADPPTVPALISSVQGAFIVLPTAGVVGLIIPVVLVVPSPLITVLPILSMTVAPVGSTVAPSDSVAKAWNDFDTLSMPDKGLPPTLKLNLSAPRTVTTAPLLNVN